MSNGSFLQLQAFNEEARTRLFHNEHDLFHISVPQHTCCILPMQPWLLSILFRFQAYFSFLTKSRLTRSTRRHFLFLCLPRMCKMRETKSLICLSQSLLEISSWEPANAKQSSSWFYEFSLSFFFLRRLLLELNWLHAIHTGRMTIML